jgi:hypothetical protein
MEQPPDPLNHNSGKRGIPKESSNPPDALKPNLLDAAVSQCTSSEEMNLEHFASV